MTLVSQTSKVITYNVPASTFSILVAPLTQAYVTVFSPPGTKAPEYASVITHETSSKPMVVHHSAAVVLAAQASSLKITSGSTTFGTVLSPKVEVTYVFNAKG